MPMVVWVSSGGGSRVVNGSSNAQQCQQHCQQQFVAMHRGWADETALSATRPLCWQSNGLHPGMATSPQVVAQATHVAPFFQKSHWISQNFLCPAGNPKHSECRILTNYLSNHFLGNYLFPMESHQEAFGKL